MEKHEFCECCDNTKLEWHGLWDTTDREMLLKDHITADSLKKALCPECFYRWAETQLLKQVIHEHLNWDWPHFIQVVVDLKKRFDLVEKWQTDIR